MAVNLQIGQSVIIGKEGNIRVNNSTVSRRHCSLTRTSQDGYMLNDLDSTNGTYVDGIAIFSTPVTLQTHVKLGNYETTIGHLLGYQVPAPGPKAASAPGPAPAKETKQVSIDHLFPIYQEYDQAVRDIQKKRARMGMNRMLFYTVPAIAGTVGSFLQDDTARSILGAFSALSVVGMVAYTMLMPSKSDELVDEQFELNQDFQLNFTCPECKNFLGQRPPKLLLKVGSCPYCKSKFVSHRHH